MASGAAEALVLGYLAFEAGVTAAELGRKTALVLALLLLVVASLLVSHVVDELRAVGEDSARRVVSLVILPNVALLLAVQYRALTEAVWWDQLLVGFVSAGALALIGMGLLVARNLTWSGQETHVA